MELRKVLLIGFIFSGIAALIYEITWIRPLQFIFGSTTYTISIIFAAFMGGLALGSYLISKKVEKIDNLPLSYALFEIGIGLYGILLMSLFGLLPNIYDSLYSLHTNFYLFEIIQFVLVFAVLLIPTTLMGATFPIVAKFYTKNKIGKEIGEVYAANNIGAIIGSFSAGFILIPLFGIKTTIIIAGIINLGVAALVLAKANKQNAFKIMSIAILVFLALSVFGGYNIEKMHSGGFYRTESVYKNLGPVLYYEEGLYATISVRQTIGNAKALFINGKGQGSSSITDLRVNALLAYLPELIYPKQNNSLVIGLGTGTTSGQLSQVSNVKTVEIEPKIIGATPYFENFNLNVLENPNHTLIINDGRNYLLKNNQKYNSIIQEPSDPWQSFSSSLFSKEFFELASDRLDRNGLYVKWVPIYTMSPEDFRSFYKTFSEVFPNNVAFANIKSTENTPVKFDTSELILVGSKEPINFTEDSFNTSYNSLPENSKNFLNSLGLESGSDVYRLLVFDGNDLKGYAQSAEPVTDDNSLLEFSTAKNVLNQNPQAVVEDINKFLEGNKNV